MEVGAPLTLHRLLHPAFRRQRQVQENLCAAHRPSARLVQVNRIVELAKNLDGIARRPSGMRTGRGRLQFHHRNAGAAQRSYDCVMSGNSTA